MASRWPSISQRARRALELTLPVPCAVCGGMVYPSDAWDVGHVVPRVVAPHLESDPQGWRVEHARCNRADGARITNTLRRGRTFGWR